MTRALLVALSIAAAAVPARAGIPLKEAVVETTLGTFVIDLDPVAAPNQVACFTKVAGEGRPNAPSTAPAE